MGTLALLNTNPGLRLPAWRCGSAWDVVLSLRTQSDVVKGLWARPADPFCCVESELERGLHCGRVDREYADDWIGQRMLRSAFALDTTSPDCSVTGQDAGFDSQNAFSMGQGSCIANTLSFSIDCQMSGETIPKCSVQFQWVLEIWLATGGTWYLGAMHGMLLQAMGRPVSGCTSQILFELLERLRGFDTDGLV